MPVQRSIIKAGLILTIYGSVAAAGLHSNQRVDG